MNESYLLDNEGMRMRTDIPNWVCKGISKFFECCARTNFSVLFRLNSFKRMNFVIPFSLIMIGVICHIQCYLLELMKERPIVRRGFFFCRTGM